MNVSIAKREELDFWNCFFLKAGTHILFKSSQVSHDSVNISTEAHEYYCWTYGSFLFGRETQYGPVLYLILSAIIFLFALYGMVTNILNVIVLRKSFHGWRHFKEYLVLLSIIELLVSIGAVGITLSTIFIMDNVDRSQYTLIFFLFMSNLFYLTRSMAVPLTILITVERYLVVAFPDKCRFWLQNAQRWKSRAPLIPVLLWPLFIQIFWTLKSTTVKNGYDGSFSTPVQWNDSLTTLMEPTNTDELLKFPYLFVNTHIGTQYNPDFLMVIGILDFLVPTPLLLVSNVLLYTSIQTWTKKCINPNAKQSQHRNVQVAKMFCGVTLISLLCNAISCLVWILQRYQDVTYTEFILLERLAITISSSTNFLIYYWFRTGYKEEFWNYLKSYANGDGVLGRWISKNVEKTTLDSSSGFTESTC